MKKLIALFICFLLIAEANGLDAQNGLRESIHRDSWEVGPEIVYHRYSESTPAESLLMKETGVLYGVYFAYTHREWVSAESKKNNLRGGQMFAAEGSLSYGEVDYDGQLQNGTPYNISGIDDSIGEIRLLLGEDSLLGTNLLMTFYTGFGYRYLLDEASVDPAGYDRESNYLYLPIGAMATCIRQHEWMHNPKLEFDLLLIGEQVSHLSDVGLSDVANQQNSGYGLRFSYGFQKKGETGNLIIEPFLRYWYIDDSEVEAIPGTFLVGLEPENETVEIGIRSYWRFY